MLFLQVDPSGQIINMVQRDAFLAKLNKVSEFGNPYLNREMKTSRFSKGLLSTSPAVGQPGKMRQVSNVVHKLHFILIRIINQNMHEHHLSK